MTDKSLRMGMVGGGRDAFIGAVHRMAARLDGEAVLTAGCFSSMAEKAIASGHELGVERDRNYPTWQAMLEGELKLPREQRIDFVSIVTPNHLHVPIAKAFAEAGMHVLCDKPLAHTSAEAGELVRIVKDRGIVFAVTYNYSGYPMIKQARAMVRSGELGDLRKIIVEYHQGWLAAKLEMTGHKQASWRTNPAHAGLGGAIGDIGSHAEHLVSYVTGLKLQSICADLTSFVPGRALDDDANLLLRFEPRGGEAARGVLIASQIETGCENDLRLQVFGKKASLHWRQEEPNELMVKHADGPDQVYRRGQTCLEKDAVRASRLPSGHPEAFIEAFANVYRAAYCAMRDGKGGLTAGAAYDFPDVVDGARSVHFIERAVDSARSERKWTDAGFEIS